MRDRLVRSTALLIFAILVFRLSYAQGSLQKVSAHVYARQAEKGYFTAIQSNLYYTSNGDLISEFISPEKYIMVTNNKGEVKIYNPKENTVMQFQNSLMSTHTIPFYFFFSGKTSDMGLHQAGYELADTKFDKKLVITTWKLANADDKKDPVFYVKLVHNDFKPVYMDYENKQHEIIRKVYYYNYTALAGIEFPKTFTEILYQGKDSIVTKTEYSNFKVNDQADNALFKFQVPENAKLVKK